MVKESHKKHHRHHHNRVEGSDDKESTGTGLKMVLKGHKHHKHHKHRHHHKGQKRLKHAANEELKSIKNEVEDSKNLALDGSLMADPPSRTLPDGSIKVEDGSEVASSRPVVASESSRAALRKLLEHFLHCLQRKDSENFFAHPVNTATAPGYYQMIKEPMDFSTMKIKLNADKYSTLAAFKSDFEKICHNACSYNTDDSVVYKFATKLLAEGQTLLSQEKIRSMTALAPLLKQISTPELGFDVFNTDNQTGDKNVEDDDDEMIDLIRRPSDRVPDQLTPQDLLNQAKAAARGAADRLRIYKAKSRMGFLRQREDGSTSLGFLTGGSGFLPSGSERPISLGALIGRVRQGTGSIQGFREDRRNLCKAVYPLYYGAYSSHGPSYDSTFANLTKEETDLVCNTSSEDALGDQSILNFSRNYDYTDFIGDHLLDVLTDNQHRASSRYVEEEKKLREEDERLYKTVKEVQHPSGGEPDAAVDFESLKSLSELGIDVSFLDTMKADLEEMDRLESLTDTASLLDELKKVQLERLSASLPVHFSQVLQPNEQEMALASQIQTNLAEMAGQVKPGDVVPQDSVRKALGMALDRIPGVAEPQKTTTTELTVV